MAKRNQSCAEWLSKNILYDPNLWSHGCDIDALRCAGPGVTTPCPKKIFTPYCNNSCLYSVDSMSQSDVSVYIKKTLQNRGSQHRGALTKQPQGFAHLGITH